MSGRAELSRSDARAHAVAKRWIRSALDAPSEASQHTAVANERARRDELVDDVGALRRDVADRAVPPKPGRGDAAATTWIVRGPRRFCLAITRPADDPRRGRGVDATKPIEMIL